MKRVSFFRTFVFLLLPSFIACGPAKKEDSAEVAQDRNVENFGTRDTEMDAAFVVKAVEDSYAEIKLAQLARNKSSNATLQKNAIAIENDYSLVLNELKDLSYKKGIAIPVEENEKVKVEIQDLQKKDEKEFDKDWLKKITALHEGAIKNFESREKTKDIELKSWIDATLPGLRAHQHDPLDLSE